MEQAGGDLKQFLKERRNIQDEHVIRYWRKEVIHWHNTAKLVELYNEALEETCEPMSIRWWQRMEKENKVPQDQKRRWIIATLLHIPPAYLGLTALKPLLPLPEEPITIPTTLEKVDLEAWKKELKTLWGAYYPREATQSILGRIYALERALISGEAQQKEPGAYLLCQYLIALGNIRRYQGYSSALTYLSEAIVLAGERACWELYAKV